jgi:hypothetical protein
VTASEAPSSLIRLPDVEFSLLHPWPLQGLHSLCYAVLLGTGPLPIARRLPPRRSRSTPGAAAGEGPTLITWPPIPVPRKLPAVTYTLRMFDDIYSLMFDDPLNPSPPATVLETVDAVFWITLFFGAFLWGAYRTHMRTCEETPLLDAKPSAADEIASQPFRF